MCITIFSRDDSGAYCEEKRDEPTYLRANLRVEIRICATKYNKMQQNKDMIGGSFALLNVSGHVGGTLARNRFDDHLKEQKHSKSNNADKYRSVLMLVMLK